MGPGPDRCRTLDTACSEACGRTRNPCGSPSPPSNCPLGHAIRVRSACDPRVHPWLTLSTNDRSADRHRRRSEAQLAGLHGYGKLQRSDVEAERPQLLTPVIGDLVRAPWRHPDPVDPVAGCQALDGLAPSHRINWVWMPPWGPDKITDDGREQLRALGFNV